MNRWQLILSWLLMSHASFAGEVNKSVDFARDVQPILEKRCWKCHGPEKQQGSLRFDRRDGAIRAGDSGMMAISPGRVSESELIRRVEATNADERMPPKSDPLTADQLRILREWIEKGAIWPESTKVTSTSRSEMVVSDEDRQHWSYRPLHGVELPAVRDMKWGRTAIDRFILRALDEKGISPSPAAERQTLIRRVYFDLIGLPPSPEDVEAFVADSSSEAYEAVVDRLLKSSQYGERWGRHWLDLARYADSGGMESDADRPTAYHYRDFVIRALNDDLPYNSFVRWQLAGDEYEPDNPLALAATGFLTGAPNEMLSDEHLEEERLRLRFNELDDMAVTTASAFLGLTIGCARCHDHKFDAIPTRDYYRLQCAFVTTSRGEVFLATRPEVVRYQQLESQWNQQLKSAESKLNGWLAEQTKPHTPTLHAAKVEALSIGDDEKKLLKEQPNSDAAKKLKKKHEKALEISDNDYRRVFSDSQCSQWDALKRDLDTVQRSQPQHLPTALAIIDTKPEPAPTWLLDRGDFYAKREPVQLGFLSVMTKSRSPKDYWEAARRDGAIDRSTGQRRALAEWLTDADQGAGALLARVMVNRVWQHHFGEGLVRSVSDFGVRAEAPSHPELLEWLANEFVRGGWQLKPLHRLILTSSVYRQQLTFDAQRAQVDPDNRLLWRRRPQRLEAEVLRDTILAVSGMLNPEQFGPAFKPPIPPEAMLARNTKNPYPKDAQDNASTRRRTVYMFHKRVVQHPLMQAFDGPDAAVSCSRRINTTVAPQALALLNDSFLRDRAADFARRLLKECGSKPDDWIVRGYQLALSRPPNDSERSASRQFIDDQLKHREARDKSVAREEIQLLALTDYCQTLFSLNEFIYID